MQNNYGFLILHKFNISYLKGLVFSCRMPEDFFFKYFFCPRYEFFYKNPFFHDFDQFELL